ncbi:hypothetical protein EW146_g5174 [Bondarzewia mesenterica]|uniref:Uncharacterized protein n=1 Tax=Bondarzewia mesenterica TaxID=1095465 RepID=A0A4S4LY33_9AGAM|nr:hypothetical protein EW146_g5174 [Bondarzewia mesenterica]
MYDVMCQYGMHLLCHFADSFHLTMPSGLEIIKGIDGAAQVDGEILETLMIPAICKKYIKVINALELVEEWASDAKNTILEGEELADSSAEWKDIPPDIILDPKANKDELIPEELAKEYANDISDVVPTEKIAIALPTILWIIECRELGLEELANQKLELQKSKKHVQLDHLRWKKALNRLDPESQIIAMSEEVCNELALIYNSDIVLNMQSANGKIDKSLGLAHNVPFLISDIVLYFQVHVIHELAYDILLGHPFDVLTESIVKNFTNENQTITIHDLNTGRNAIIKDFIDDQGELALIIAMDTQSHL